MDLYTLKRFAPVIGAVFAGLVVYIIVTSIFAKPTLITVIGEGRLKIEPNAVKYNVSIINSAASAAQALEDNKKKVKDAVDVLNKNNVTAENMQISYATIVPPSTTNNYSAVSVIGVTQNDIYTFENTTIELYNKGVWNVSDVVFTTQDPQSLEKLAIDSAIKSVEQRAKELAKSTKRRLGRMVSISTSEVGDAGSQIGEFGFSGFGSLNPLPSQIEIVRQATAVYEVR